MSTIALLTLLALAPSGTVAEATWNDGSFTSSEAERFLHAAKRIGRASLPTGVTRSAVLKLRDGSHEARAVWKTLDQHKQIQRFEGGVSDLGFRDSWTSEVAAYEIDKLLDLHMVPPTVERRMRGDLGSLQLWLEGVVTEAKRRKEHPLAASEVEAYNRQMHSSRVFHQLIQDTDYKNVSNLLLDGNLRLYIVDSSRAFRTEATLTNAEYLRHFSRSLIARLRDLNLEVLEKRVGRWLNKKQIEALLQRRDLILERVFELVARHGEAAVLYP